VRAARVVRAASAGSVIADRIEPIGAVVIHHASHAGIRIGIIDRVSATGSGADLTLAGRLSSGRSRANFASVTAGFDGTAVDTSIAAKVKPAVADALSAIAGRILSALLIELTRLAETVRRIADKPLLTAIDLTCPHRHIRRVDVHISLVILMIHGIVGIVLVGVAHIHLFSVISGRRGGRSVG